jgi:parallel beta-helix repeat protein
MQGNVIHDITAAAGSNAGGIRPDHAHGAIIRNNYIYNVSEEGAPYRGAGILSYDFWDGVVENNEIWNVPEGIMYKRQYADRGQVTRYNYIHDVSDIAIRFNTVPPSYAAGTTYGAVNHTVHNNIIIRAKMGISLWECDDAVSRNNKFYNNTFVDTPRGIYMPLGTADSPAVVETTQFWNNILYNTIDGGSQWDTVLMMVDKPAFVSVSDYNDFYETTPWLPVAWNKETLTFEQYRTNSGLDGHSLFADPLFVDKANHNFRLQPDSPARGTGLGGVNMGAYATGNEIIGPVIGADTLAPAAPSNLTVQ